MLGYILGNKERTDSVQPNDIIQVHQSNEKEQPSLWYKLIFQSS